MSEQQVLAQAITDLARVFIACNDRITSKAEAVRRLNLAAVPPSRIASLLSMPTKDVTSQLSKEKKATGGRKDRRRAD